MTLTNASIKLKKQDREEMISVCGKIIAKARRQHHRADACVESREKKSRPGLR